MSESTESVDEDCRKKIAWMDSPDNEDVDSPILLTESATTDYEVVSSNEK